MSSRTNGKLPILGNISVPLRLMHYQEKDENGKDIKEKFFQSDHAYFKLQDSVADVTGNNGEDCGNLGGSFGGHYEAMVKEPLATAYVILDVEEMWKGITDVLGSESAKLVFEGIEETYKKFWAQHEKEKAENMNIMESKKAALEERRKADEAKRIKEAEEASERMKKAEKAQIKRSEEKLKRIREKAKEDWTAKDKGNHEPYNIGKMLIVNDGGWDLNKNLDHMHDYDFLDDGMKIPVDMGCGVKAVDGEGKKCWTSDVNEDKVVELELHTYCGISPGAVHYYAKLKFRLPSLRATSDEGYEYWSSKWDLKLLGSASIELTRPFELWERKADPERWRGYRTVDEEMPTMVNAWYDIPSAKKRANEVFDQIFGEGWKLKMLEDREY